MENKKESVDRRYYILLLGMFIILLSFMASADNVENVDYSITYINDKFSEISQQDCFTKYCEFIVKLDSHKNTNKVLMYPILDTKVTKMYEWKDYNHDVINIEKLSVEYECGEWTDNNQTFKSKKCYKYIDIQVPSVVKYSDWYDISDNMLEINSKNKKYSALSKSLTKTESTYIKFVVENKRMSGLWKWDYILDDLILDPFVNASGWQWDAIKDGYNHEIANATNTLAISNSSLHLVQNNSDSRPLNSSTITDTAQKLLLTYDVKNLTYTYIYNNASNDYYQRNASMSYVDGMQGQGLRFDGTSYIDLTNGWCQANDIDGNFTFMTSFKLPYSYNSTNTSMMYIFECKDYYYLYLDDGWLWCLAPGGSTKSSDRTFVKDRWYHVACVFNSTDIELVLNGESNNITGGWNFTNAIGSTASRIGNEAVAGAFFDGILDNTMIVINGTTKTLNYTPSGNTLTTALTTGFIIHSVQLSTLNKSNTNQLVFRYSCNNGANTATILNDETEAICPKDGSQFILNVTMIGTTEKTPHIFNVTLSFFDRNYYVNISNITPITSYKNDTLYANFTVVNNRLQTNYAIINWTDNITGNLYNQSMNVTSNISNFTLLNSGNFTKNTKITLNITATNGSVTENSNYSIVILDSPIVTSNITFKETPYFEYRNISVVWNFSDIDNDNITYYYTWFRNATEIYSDVAYNISHQLINISLDQNNFSENHILTLQLIGYDFDTNATKLNSSNITIGDFVNPALYGDNINPTTGTTSLTTFNISINVTDNNTISMCRMYILDPTNTNVGCGSPPCNMTQSSTTLWYKEYITAASGTFKLNSSTAEYYSFSCTDLSGNIGYFNSSKTFVSSTSGTGDSPGGGGGSDSVKAKDCNIDITDKVTLSNSNRVGIVKITNKEKSSIVPITSWNETQNIVNVQTLITSLQPNQEEVINLVLVKEMNETKDLKFYVKSSECKSKTVIVEIVPVQDAISSIKTFMFGSLAKLKLPYTQTYLDINGSYLVVLSIFFMLAIVGLFFKSMMFQSKVTIFILGSLLTLFIIYKLVAI